MGVGVVVADAVGEGVGVGVSIAPPTPPSGGDSGVAVAVGDGVDVGVGDGVVVGVEVVVALGVAVGCESGAVVGVAVGDGVGVCVAPSGQDVCRVTPVRSEGLSLIRNINWSPGDHGWSHRLQLNVRTAPASAVAASSKSRRRATDPSSAMKSM